MTSFVVLTYPHPLLKKPTARVEGVDEALKETLAAMANYIVGRATGLAANQIGISKRFLVMSMGGRTGDYSKVYQMVNPEIIWSSEQMCTMSEGCLSLPGVRVELERPEKVRCRYMNEKGEMIEEEFEGVLARCLQHEIDHLDGKVSIDRLSRLKRELLLKKMTKK